MNHIITALLWLVFTVVLFMVVTVCGFTYDLDVHLDKNKQDIRTVIGLGLPQTGSSSLSHALMTLGYQVQHFPLNLETKLELYREKRNALVDVTLLKFRPLDMYNMYPDAIFVYTSCEEKTWVSSMFQLRETLEKWAFIPSIHCILHNFDEIFGRTTKSLKLARTRYEKEIQELTQKTKVYEFDILSREPDIEKWRKLCKIVNVDTPRCIFPNTSPLKQHMAQVWRFVK